MLKIYNYSKIGKVIDYDWKNIQLVFVADQISNALLFKVIVTDCNKYTLSCIKFGTIPIPLGTAYIVAIFILYRC